MTDYNRGLSEFVAAVGARRSTPGGGAVAGVVGAQAAALISMVAEFSGEALLPTAATAKHSANHLLDLSSADSDGFNQVMAAYGLPKSDTTRSEQIQQALVIAMDAPRGILAEAIKLVELLPFLLTEGNRNLVSDTAMAAILLDATLASAELNVRINLKSVKAQTIINEVTNELAGALIARETLRDIITESSALVG